MNFERSGNIFCCTFPDSGCTIRASRVRELGSGDYRGLLELFNGDVLLHSSVANLCTASGRQGVAKSLNGHKQNWSAMLDTACAEIVHRLHMGSPTIEIRSEDPAQAESHLVEPILPLNQSSLVFGKGGSTKSYLALTIAVCVSLPVTDNLFSWKVGARPVPTLYLDNESDKTTFHHRLKQAVRGLGVPPVHMFYRRLTGALVNEIEAVQRSVMEHRIGLVILDSGGKAISGNLNDPAPVNDLFNALASLECTCLIVHHEPKDQALKSKSPLGSQYWESNPRRVWRLERGGGSETDFTVCLSCFKSNDSRLYRPTGYRVQFTQGADGDAITYHPTGLQDSEFADRLSLRVRMVELLRRGKLPVAAIAAELGERPEVVRARLHDHKDTFSKVGEEWGLRFGEQ